MTKIGARNKFDVHNNGSPAKSTPPIAQFVSISSLQRKRRAKVDNFKVTEDTSTVKMSRIMIQWPSHCKIIINRGNTIIIFITWERGDKEERGEEEEGQRRGSEWLHGRWDTWKQKLTDKQKQNKKTKTKNKKSQAFFSFFCYSTELRSEVMMNRCGEKDGKKRQRWQIWGGQSERRKKRKN